MKTLAWFLASQVALAIVVWGNTEMPLIGALWAFSATYPLRMVGLAVWDEIDDEEEEYAPL